MLGGIIGGALGAAGSVLGGISKNNMLKKQIAMINEQKRENQDWYDRRYNEDSTQRADAQAMLTQTREEFRNRNRSAAGSAAVMGGTDESIAAVRAENAKAMADATSSIVQAGEQRKDGIEQQYIAKNDALNNQLRELDGQKQGAFDLVGGAIGGAASGFASGMGLG